MNGRRATGFSLVELMVSVVIGMLALMFAVKVITGAEVNKQAALGGSDSMQNGMLAMFSINNDAAQAGYGLNDPVLDGCDTVMTDTGGYTLASATRGAVTVHPLAAAVIGSGGAGPDTITLYSGSSMGGTGTLRLTTDYVGGATINVDRKPYGFSQGDVVVMAPEAGGGQCALAQISSNPGALPSPPSQQYVMISGGGGNRFNSGALGVSYNAGTARLFDLGPAKSLSFHTWSVSDGFLRLSATDLSGAGGGAAVADNIVSIKAQYGFDTSAPFNPDVAGLRVSQWSATMIDADGDGVTGGAGDYQRVAALRIAVVARSKSPERAAPGSTTCSATAAKPTVFSSAQPSGVTAVPVTVDVAVAGDAVDWKCYRYRVFETIVPLRNTGWRPSAS
ncbi:MAG: PilW family protein [Telluria sp.]